MDRVRFLDQRGRARGRRVGYSARVTRLRDFRAFALRDALLVVLAAAAVLADARLRGAGATGPVATIVGVLAGATASLAGFLCHEWGHLAGTVAAGGTARAPRTLASPFLFYFDVARSDRRAFLWMSYGGYAASLLAVAVLLACLPWAALSGKVAAIAAGLGTAVTLALEIPTTVRVARGAALPRGGVFADEGGHPRAR